MTGRVLLAALVTATLAGCTHHQLERSTVLATSTVMDIQYRIVLTNLAKLSSHPEALPDHADLADGVVQVNDRLGFGQSGGVTTFTGGSYGLGLDRFGASGQRQVTEQWGADATTDPQRLTDLQDLYRVALGLQPLPPPNAIAYLRRRQAEKAGKVENTRSSASGELSSQAGGPAGRSPNATAPRDLPTAVSTAAGRGPSQGPSGGGDKAESPGSESSGGDGPQRGVPIEVLLTDVPPPGWFHVGCKKDVPKGACHVGHYGSLYAWVMPDGIPSLSRFTVTVLSVVKLRPGESARKHGLAVTAGGR